MSASDKDRTLLFIVGKLRTAQIGFSRVASEMLKFQSRNSAIPRKVFCSKAKGSFSGWKELEC